MALEKLQAQSVANMKPLGLNAAAHVNRPVSHHSVHVAKEQLDAGKFSLKRGHSN
jgi:hypothetical protein